MSNHIQVALKFRLYNQEMRNIFYFSGGGVDSNEQNIVDYLRGAYATYLSASLVDNLQLYGADVRDVGVASLPTIPYTFTSGTLTMSNTGTPLPTQVCALVTFRANVAPPNKTRKFVMGLQYGGIDHATGLITTAQIGNLEGWADEILDITTTYSGVALSAVGWTGTPPYVNGSNLMTFREVSPIPSTQRRRKIGVGI